MGWGWGTACSLLAPPRKEPTPRAPGNLPLAVGATGEGWPLATGSQIRPFVRITQLLMRNAEFRDLFLP